MKKVKIIILLLFTSLAIISCSKEDIIPNNPMNTPDATENADQEIDQFVWRGLNLWYLYKESVPNLADNKFSSISSPEFLKFLSSFSTPQNTFDALLDKSQDRFSWIVDDFVSLEQGFSGISKSNGMDFMLSLVSQGSDDVIGIVRYVIPNTDAATKGVKRGEIFNTINGQKLTRLNFQDLLFNNSDAYEVGFTNFANGSFVPTKTVDLINTEITENPILLSKTVEYQGNKVGYLMYNQFVGGKEADLNDVFGQFKADGITDLVLDLRYNPGGAGTSATALASMITGQFNDQVFFKRSYNKTIQAAFLAQDPDNLITKFSNTLPESDVAINSLGLTRLYILTSSSSASASELMINSLRPYLDIIQIGDTTSGKFQGSITLYDSNNFGKEGANPNHKYAMQPLVVKTENKDGVSDFINGLTPDIVLKEDFTNLIELGNPDEPLLNAALENIATGVIKVSPKNKTQRFNFIGERKMYDPNYQRMYLDLPKIQL